MNAPNIIPPLAIFEPHPLRLLIQEELAKVAVGDTMTYADIDDLVGFNVRTEAPHLLQEARDQLIDDGIVFDTVIGVGVKRAGDSNVVAILEGRGKRIVNAAKRSARILKKVPVDYDALSPAERIRFGIEQVRIGIVQHFGRKAIVRQIGAALERGTDAKQLSSAVAGSLKQFK
jgi:hypothetical protein